MNALLELRGVSKTYVAQRDLVDRWLDLAGRRAPPQSVMALHATDLRLRAGEIVGLVGESGCGKSTLGRLAAGLQAPTTGQRLLDGVAPEALAPAARLRAQLGVQMIFQDPHASLNPRLRVGQAVAEGPLIHGLWRKSAWRERVARLFEMVRLDPALMDRYAHQFSGGQRARVGIARALAVEPKMLVCDESIAALDVSIQAKIVELFVDLRQRLGLTYLFISHDLGVVQHLADRVVVMYLGRVVESAPTEALYAAPAHPYTQALLASMPRLERRRHIPVALAGEIPSPLHPPTGCHFHPRCPRAIERCRSEAPALRNLAGEHAVACHLV